MSRQLTKKVISAVTLLILTLTLTGCSFTPKAATGDSDQQVASDGLTGNAEAQEISVNTKIPGRVVQLLVKEGQPVKTGELLAQIDDSDLKILEESAQAAIQAAKGDISKATAAMNATDSTTAAAINKAQAGVDKAKADADLALKTYERMKALHEADVISDQEMDSVENKYQLSLVGVNAAQADLKTAQAARTQMDVYAADIQRAQASMVAAQGKLKEVQNNMAETQIKAPCDGTISSLNVNEGEMVSIGLPLMNVTNYSDNWVNVKVSQTLLETLTVGQEATILISSQNNRELKGTITDISRKPDFATTRSTNERNEKDIVSFNVKVQVNSPDLTPGMQVSVKFN